MSGAPARRGRAILLLGPMAAFAALAIAICSRQIRDVLIAALAHVSCAAVLATIPGQLAASLLCSAALFLLRPGVSFGASIASRLLRDAGANLLLFMPGLGDVIGARALVLAGGRTRTAVAASALDSLAETLAQMPYVLLALLMLPRVPLHVGNMSMIAGWLPWIAAALTLAAVLLGLWVWTNSAAWRCVAGRVRAEFALFRRELRNHSRQFPLAIAIHFGAWAMGGVQIWMIARTLSFDIGVFPAIIIESAAYGARAIAFFVPAGIAVQEGALVLAGLLYGLTPSQSLAVALILRMRDLLFGLPLLVWPVAELCRLRVAGALKDQV